VADDRLARQPADGGESGVVPAELASTQADEAQQALASRIRQWRQHRGLTVRALAERCGVTGGFISQVERAIASPSVGSLYRMAAALDVPVEVLFREGPPGPAGARPRSTVDGVVPPGLVVRRSERRHLELSDGMHWAKLSPDEDTPHEFLEIVMDVGASTGRIPLRHGGREYAVIEEGVARFEIGFQHYTLYPGDSIAFDSSIPHRTVNVGSVPVRGIHFMLDANVLGPLHPERSMRPPAER
jgi:transcriptional regulator with XRE-family HTH domain